MGQDKPNEGDTFFKELSLRLRCEGIEYEPPNGNRLPILFDGCEVGFVTPEGVVQIRQAYIDAMDARQVYHRAWEVAEEVHEYMMLMRYAPLLKADSLHAP